MNQKIDVIRQRRAFLHEKKTLECLRASATPFFLLRFHTVLVKTNEVKMSIYKSKWASNCLCEKVLFQVWIKRELGNNQRKQGRNQCTFTIFVYLRPWRSAPFPDKKWGTAGEASETLNTCHFPSFGFAISRLFGRCNQHQGHKTREVQRWDFHQN